MIANSQQRRKRLRKKCYSFFFLERASTSNFCYATNQSNPQILNYVSYDRPRPLQLCGKFFLWALPIPPEISTLQPPHPLGISIGHPWGGGGGGGGLYGYFLESHISKPAALDIIMRGSNGLIALHYYRPKQQEILEACIYKCGYVLHALSRFEMNIDDSRSIGLFSLPCNN